MRTRFGVEAIFIDAKTLDGAAGDEVLGNDDFCIFGADVAVPHRLGVNDDHGAVLALIEAAGLVDAHAAGEAGFPAQLLQAAVQFAFAVGSARRTGRVGWADIVANEDVAFKPGQAGILLNGA